MFWTSVLTFIVVTEVPVGWVNRLVRCEAVGAGAGDGLGPVQVALPLCSECYVVWSVAAVGACASCAVGCASVCGAAPSVDEDWASGLKAWALHLVPPRAAHDQWWTLGR